MAVLAWGKCSLESTPVTDGAPEIGATWTAMDIPKQDTTKLTPSAGEETTAQEEGGDLVDVRYGKTTYEFEFDMFVKKGKQQPFTNNDGVVDGEHAIRLTPEDDTLEGIQIDRCKVRAEENFSTKEGKWYHYVCKCLKPKTGNTIKPYTKTPGQ